MSAADVAVAFAISQIGKPYLWGAAGPNSYDCSGLTMTAYKQAGISLPHNAKEQSKLGTAVIGQPMPGDLMFPSYAHVQLCVNNTTVVEAASSGTLVRLAPYRKSYWRIQRITSPGSAVTITPGTPISSGNIASIDLPSILYQIWVLIKQLLSGG